MSLTSDGDTTNIVRSTSLASALTTDVSNNRLPLIP